MRIGGEKSLAATDGSCAGGPDGYENQHFQELVWRTAGKERVILEI